MNWFSGFGTDTTGAFSGVADKLSGKGALGVSKGGGMIGISQLVGPFASLTGSALGYLSGKGSADALLEGTNRNIDNRVRAANFSSQLKTNAQSLQAAMGLLPMQFGELIAAPRELERQKEAQKFKFGELRDLARAGESEDFRRQMERLNDPNLREAARFQSRLQGQQQAFANRARLAGMFGSIGSDFA